MKYHCINVKNVVTLKCYVTFALFFSHLAWACLFVFNIKNYIFGKSFLAFHTKSEMNKCQVEGKVNACFYSILRSSNLSAVLLFWIA